MTDKYKNLEKIVVSAGIGKLRNQPQFDEKILPEIMKDISMITGQKPIPCPAKKAIAGFKTRKGDVVGVAVTLRGRMMRDFALKVIRVVLPRVKDFRGLSLENVDSGGNLNIGLKEQVVFPEIEAEHSRVQFGLQITFVPVLKKRKEAIEFYQSIGVPFRK